MQTQMRWHLKKVVMRKFVCLLVVLCSCESNKPAQSTYFEERIAPILQLGCVQQTAGCHLANPEGTAVGNLDLSSYDALVRRRDALVAYGPYVAPLLLLKGGEPSSVQVETLAGLVSITTDIRHNAGSGLALDSRAYATLRQWLAEGFSRTGGSQVSLAKSIGNCRNGVGSFPGFSAEQAPSAASYRAFVDDVQPVLRERCAGSSCHGSPIADLYLSCGDTEQELRWNYFAAVQHVTNPAASSELLRRPLSKNRGGTFHEGGDIFASTDDGDYQKFSRWVEQVAAEEPAALSFPDTAIASHPGFQFFVNRVQPALVRKGCMFLGCHSPSMFHDLRYNGGGQGVFSRVAMWRNYQASLGQLAVESADPCASRIVAKNLYPAERVPGGHGVLHRGGSLFEDFDGAADCNPNLCAGVDAEGGDLNSIPAYCVLAEWLQKERQALGSRLVDETTQSLSLVWVERSAASGSPLDFATYRPSSLRQAPLSYNPTLRQWSLGASQDLATACPSLSVGADMRTPAGSWDGKKLAFAARSAANQPLRIFEVNLDDGACRQLSALNPQSTTKNGILLHDWDPAYTPDGRLVFASTRGDASGPTLTPASLAPNANLYVYAPEQGVRQLTFLLNQEFGPSLMADGRVIFSAEKRGAEFHQLAGRRINLDGGDYHPLFAQRASVGFAAATEITELSNRNLMMIAGPVHQADGAGAIAIINRSLGPDQIDRNPADRFYFSSRRMLPSAFLGGQGVFRSPAALPGSFAVVSCDLGAQVTNAAKYNFSLCTVDLASGAVKLLQGGAASKVEAVAVFPRAPREVFVSRRDEVNGRTEIKSNERAAEIHYLDFPLLSTLLFANTRVGRPIDKNVGGFNVLVEEPPPAGVTSFAQLMGNVMDDSFGKAFQKTRKLGTVQLNQDGSTKVRIPGGVPIIFQLTNRDGEPLSFGEGGPFTGEMIQRESMQFYPGEHAAQSMPRALFNGICAGCHGSITGREIDIAVNIDVLTHASATVSRDQNPVDLSQ